MLRSPLRSVLDGNHLLNHSILELHCILLGFQAIISATNDKIQNYLENVDKTFVYANPNKKNISIQEFEKCEFDNLVTEE